MASLPSGVDVVSARANDASRTVVACFDCRSEVRCTIDCGIAVMAATRVGSSVCIMTMDEGMLPLSLLGFSIKVLR